MKKNIILSAIILCGVFGIISHLLNESNANNTDLLKQNIEALTTESSNSNSLWFSNLRTVEYTTKKVNAGGGFYYKGIFIAAGATYTYYGSKKRCERELTINTCELSDETACN